MKSYTSSKYTELFKTHESHSPEEVLAAGGATAFGKMSGKNNETLVRALENAPAEPFTEEEWDKLMVELKSDK